MDEDYRVQLENSNIHQLLLNRNNISPLEELLDTESQRLMRIQKLKDESKLDFGQQLNVEELNELFPQIKEEVDTFLGITGIDTPDFGYYSLFKFRLSTIPILVLYSIAAFNLTLGIAQSLKEFVSGISAIRNGFVSFVAGRFLHSLYADVSYYDLSTESITLSKEKRVILILDSGHEYTHHVQEKMGLERTFLDKYSTFAEGYAMGVERYLANKYREREDNEAFLYEVLDDTVGGMKSSYIWMCEKLDITPSKSLLKVKSSWDLSERFCRTLLRRPLSHAIGNTLLYLYETTQGDQVYKEIIHGNFEFAR